MTEFFLGKRTYHSYSIESSYGVRSTETYYDWMGIVQNIAPNSKSEIKPMSAMDDTDSRNVGDYFETLRNYGCNITFLLQHCRPLMLAYGSDTFVSGSPATHTLTEEETLPSFTLQFGYQHSASPHAIDYTGCMVNRLTIDCAKGEYVKCNMEVIAQNGADSPEDEFRSYSSEDGRKKYPPVGSGSIRPYMYSDAEFSIGGSSYCTVESVQLVINNDLLAEPVLCSDNGKRISEPIPQIRTYTAEFTVRMASDTLYDLWEADGYIDPAPTVTFARSSTDKVVFTLNKARLESAISPFNIEEGTVIVKLPMKVQSIGVVETNDIDAEYNYVGE